MIRFCRKEDISKKEYGAALARKPLLLDETIWKKGREYFRFVPWDEENLFFIPVVNETGDILCFAYQDHEADRELRFLKEIQETYGALQFTDIFPDKTSVTILGCNELAFYFLQYLKEMGITVLTAGRYWEYFGYRQSYEEAGADNLVIYAEGTEQGRSGGCSVNKVLCSMSAEFECIDQIYEENFKWGIIQDAAFPFEKLIDRINGTAELVIIGVDEKSQDTYDLMLSKGVDIYGFMEEGMIHPRTLFGKPVLGRKEGFTKLSAPVFIQCKDRNSALGTEQIDHYSYYGYGRNRSFYLIHDYTEVPESKLIHIMDGKKIVLAGDERLCEILKKFYRKELGNRVTIRYTDHIEDETVFDEIAVLAFYRPYGEAETNKHLIEKLNSTARIIKNKRIDHTDYFQSITHFIDLDQENEKYRSLIAKPKGIMLGKIPAASGNVFFRDILDGHTQILKMDYTFLNHNLLSYCIRLSCVKSENILESFWRIYDSEANLKYFSHDFPDKSKFDEKISNLLKASDAFSSQELFIIFVIAYESMFESEKLKEWSDKIIYWEPHYIDRKTFEYFTRWLEDNEILGTTIHIVRNRVILSGSRMCFHLQERNKFMTCVKGESTRKSYESPHWKEIIVRFEDLKLSPAKIIGEICDMAGIHWSDTLLQTTWRGKSNSYYSTTGFDNRPVYDSYEEYLSVFDRFRIAVANGYEQKKYGYPYLEVTAFSRKELQDMYLKDFRFDEQVTFRNDEERLHYKRKFYHMLCTLLWETRKRFLLDERDGTDAESGFEDISKVHRFWTPERERTLEEIRRFISGHDQIILYGTGIDAKEIYSRLTTEEREKLICSDKKAEKGEYEFEGRRVVSPKRIPQEFGDAGIIISSSQFGEEILRDLVDMGIDTERIYRNTVGQDMRKY